MNEGGNRSTKKTGCSSIPRFVALTVINLRDVGVFEGVLDRHFATNANHLASVLDARLLDNFQRNLVRRNMTKLLT